ncbi:hypothetical protein JVT61DRAFT_3464 [Boletus reticuloceps]|uniref:Uncharacterized protein n=1 Tax=Boletus reticuloceps TaxID=495285 RepID=A0A8I3A7Z8_9AGAM|nr:hypothetical protein JVT61DRAFT_3464 [Boletus reticuloceps]
MSTLAALFHVLVATYRLIVALWNAYIVFLQIIQTAMQEAKQEAVEVMTLLDDEVPLMDAVTSTLLSDTPGSVSPGQMLIIARASSFVLLLRLSKHRVLHLEVDEKFIMAKLEVIQTELMLHIRHVPWLLQAPIGMHDTRLVRYTPLKLPYLWKEEQAVSWCEDEAVVGSIVPAAPPSPVSVRPEGSSHRREYVQVLKESALRRRLHMDRLGRVGLEATRKREVGAGKARGDNVVKRKALVNSTNKDTTRTEARMDADGTSDETQGLETSVADTPKQMRMERNIHAALSENLSFPNMVQTTSLGKAAESVQQPRRSGPQSLRRRRSQFDLYAQGVQSEFSLLPKMGQGRED